jgi:murein DD-endopeptidase MepM/ murein hydrolase activator NlpD
MEIRSNVTVPIPRTAPWRQKNSAEQALAPQQAMPMALASASSFAPSQSSISNRFKDLANLGFRSSQPIIRAEEHTGSIAVAAAQPLDLEPSEASIVDAPEVTSSDQTIVKLADAASRLETEMLDSQAILHNLLKDLRNKTMRVEQRVAALGVTIDSPKPAAMGGPFIPLSGDVNQDTIAEDAEKVEVALDHFMQLKRSVYRLPISHPLPTGRLSSRFGIRKDPFLNRMSMHAGIDVADKHGTPIRAAGYGTVTHAGRKSGYGLMVEIDHGNGVISRYAHMSKVLAKKGEKASKGTILGKVGTTGRSTGPHLHFETRVHGKAVNPYSFLVAGQELRKLI